MFIFRPRTFVRALVAALLCAAASGASARVGTRDGGGGTDPGTVINNSAEATYIDSDGTGFRTLSPTVSVTVLAVSGLVVTPDETDPTATVSPNERIERLFRVCNTGNTPDLYTITAASVTAPASIASLHFDLDSTGTLTDGDRAVTLGTTLSPRLARGECVGVVATVDTNASAQGSRLSVSLTAHSNVLGTAGGVVEDSGTVVNEVGQGARLTSPDDPKLPPVKLVEDQERTTAAPGQVLHYSISFRNSGDVTARRVVLRDELPAGLDFVAGTIRLENKTLTDAEDADEGAYANRVLTLRLAELKPGDVVRLLFQARVNAQVAPGAGVINGAQVSAANAPLIASTTAMAVVNPFGLVYEGRSGGASAVPGARVTLLADMNSGTPVSLPGAGSTPNDANANPFDTDGQGRWSFVLAPEHIASSPRYFLNVTAAGFRSRMLEVAVTPSASSGLFALTVRALDGQPVAEAGGFALTTEAVTTPQLAAFALNVPMFENSAVEIQKSADRQTAEVGEVVSYRVEVHNATAATLEDTTVRDTLPPSFHYAEASARLSVGTATPRPAEPEQLAGGALLFRLGTLAPGARATLVYRVRIGVNANAGEQFNSATVEARFGQTGERTSAGPARASVRVRGGLFSTQQVVLGRVFEDADGDGQFDDGERPLAGVRLYLNNGQSVLTDSEGLYNFPTVGEGSHVIALDPVTLPPGYALSNANRRDQMSWTRLLRTPLGGGALLRQNFALLPPAEGDGATARRGDGETKSDQAASQPESRQAMSGLGNALAPAAGRADSAPTSQPLSPSPRLPLSPSSSTERAAGTYEDAAAENVEPVAPGKVKVVSPAPEGVVTGAALEVEARVAEGWTVELEVNGERVSDSKIGERRADHKNLMTSYAYVGINVRPGPNKVAVAAVGPAGERGERAELVVYGRGPAKRLEVTAAKSELSAGGRDRTTLRVRAFDQWNHPAADGAVAVEVTSGRLLRAANESTREPDAKSQNALTRDGASEINDAQEGAQSRQQLVTLSGGEAAAEFVTDGSPGEVEVRATTGTLEAETRLRVTPEVRPSILVGLAEVSVGKAAPEMSLRGDDEDARGRMAFFYRGPLFGKNLLTLAYDSQRPLNRTSGNDRLFQLDPLQRAYPIFGDSSTRYEDAQSNSKLYARLDRGRSYLMFGDYETENRDAGLASYTRKLTGVKLHVENSRGDYVSVTGARPDTAFARDVFAGGALGLTRLTHTDILPGSETVVIEVRDRRNPAVVISREPLVRSVDYNLDAATGELFFMRPVSTFDYALNLVQVVVTYEHRAEGMSSAVYTARAVKNIESLGLRLGLSVVDQKQSEFGSFVVGGVEAEKKLPQGGRVRAEWATSRGRVAFSGNLFGGGGTADDRHDGNAFRAELDQPLPFRQARLRASFLRADQNFMNPFGATTTPGSRRAEVSVEMQVRRKSRLRFGLVDERNKTSNVDNSRMTGSVEWTEQVNDRLRVTAGYDARRYEDNTSGNGTSSNLVTVGAEWQATDKLELSVKREQNLSEADPTYPNQTTLAANYKWSQFTRLFFTQRLGSAPITPIGDFSSTGFAVSGARRETAVGIETRLGRFANLNSRYQLENGVNGTDSFAVIGLQNRFAITKELSLDLGYERGFHLAGLGQSFNNLHFGFGWQPTEDFRANARYEMRDRGGMGSALTVGAAGRLADNVTTMARVQFARAGFSGRDSSSFSVQAALAWRPLHSDDAGLLFSYTRRQTEQSGLEGVSVNYERADVLSSDGYYQLSKNFELYGRFALRFGDNGTAELVRVSSLAYLAQGRAVYRLGRYFDLGLETRQMFAPSSRTRRSSYGSEIGYWVLPDLRVGGGYNLTTGSEAGGANVLNARRGFYFTLSSKLSNLFDLFGTSRHDETSTPAGAGDDAGAAPAASDKKPE